jgi:hypothetical protein
MAHRYPLFLSILFLFIFQAAYPQQVQTAVNLLTSLPTLPLNQQSFKIEVTADGIFELTYQALAAAGMPVNSVNPHTFEMMHDGEPVAYQFWGDADTSFEPGEAIRFYGWTFSGSRHDHLFVDRNLFWLWANGSPTRIDAAPAHVPTPNNAQTGFMATIDTAPANDYFSTWTDQWPNFPNEADAWYWDRMPQVGIGSTQTAYTYMISLPNPDLTSTTSARLTAEFMSRANAPIPNSVQYEVMLHINDNPTTTAVWQGRQNINITQTISVSTLRHGENVVTAVVTTPDVLYLNRISATYPRQLVAQGNQLLFSTEANAKSWQVDGFTVSDAKSFLVWNVGEPKRPFAIPISPANISGTDSYQLTFNHPLMSDTHFIATITDNVMQPDAIGAYTAVDLTPPTNQAEWLAIIHPPVTDAAQQLANYRQTHSNLSTHIVTINDIINQYGHGFRTPKAVQTFLRHALTTWSVPPRYVLLFGDATLNPLQRDCQFSCGSGWDTSAQTDVLTDLQFVDQYQGLIPTDTTFSLLLGDDLLPDIAVGRIAASTNNEALIVVDKIIAYEQSQVNETAVSRPILFVADQDDAAGAFCNDNQNTGQLIPPVLSQTHLCLPQNPSPADVSQLRSSMHGVLNGQGAWLLNYRGHGSIQFWGSGGTPLLSVAKNSSTLGSWTNQKPTVIISADCLDGHFAWPGVPSISETLLKLPNGGTAAHWSSTGLGTNSEHTIMHTHFYNAIFQSNLTVLGDAINEAKVGYLQSDAHAAPLYSFTLQGDPALSLAWSQQTHHFLPFIQK